MQGYEIKFNVYANSQAEADRASGVIKDFISEKALLGIAVTANKITEAVSKYKNNPFVTGYLK